MTELDVAKSALDEAIKVTDAYREQITKLDPKNARLLDHAALQLEAAERREYACWLQVEKLGGTS